MTPAARVQAAIELLDEIIVAAQENGPAADTLITRYFKTRRYAGSKDRRAVRELVYQAIRRSGEQPDSGRAALVGLARQDDALAALFDGSTHGPAVLIDDEPAAEAGDAAPWLTQHQAALGRDYFSASLERAPLHLRVNSLRADRDAILAELPQANSIAGTKLGVMVPEGTAVDQLDAHIRGAIEVQDAGSQLIVAACAVVPGMTVLDLCAGAGGKTLALAADMAGQGQLVASDTVRDRLARLVPRAERTGAASIIEPLLLDGGNEPAQLASLTHQCDVVLIDAPCTGTGTWRRNPEARWRLTPERLERMVALQRHVLALGAPLVKPSGALVYAVCSLLATEGENQIAHFLSENPGWQSQNIDAGRKAGDGTILTPDHDGTDGFFFARLIKAC